MTAPLGIGDRSPELSWKLPAGVQTAHQVQVASSAAALARGEADVWDSGKVLSSRTSAAFGGPPLQSRRQVHWRVRSWIGAGGPTDWSEPSRWETGLLESSDWTARWIGEKAWNDYLDTTAKPVTIDLPPQAARYVRLDVTKLGLPVPEGALGMVSRLQLAELELLDSTDANANRARAATVTASNPYVAGGWSLPGLVDGVLTTPGYTSLHSATQSVNPSFWVQLDLGAVRHFDKLVLFPRTDFTTADGRIPNFPVDFTLQTGTDAGALSTVKTVVGLQPPPKPPLPAGLPLFAKEFVASKPVAEARLYATGLGVYEATVNGRPVGDAVLEPGNTDYADRVIAATYDVTPLIRSGENVIGTRVGTGIYDTQTYGGRYAKFAERVGAPKLLAQLEITYADGTRETVGTGTDWKTTAGPTTFSNWFGGEDYDARREPTGWDAPGGERSGWAQAVPASPPSATTQVSARTGPPVEVTDRIAPVKITQPRPGIWVFDLGVNIAGWQELKVSGMAGTTITMRPAELLAADGTIDQGQTGSPIYDRYTLRGAGTETWRPHFVYHGFRYLQVEGLTSAPDAGTITGIVLRAANRSVGTFASSDATINGIHRIIDRAVQGNMFSVLTDCPHREKLGWLEETHLVFDTVARNYDVQAYGRDLVRNMADAQLANGLVPDIAPEYTVFSGGFRDDPNWGSAMILVPWNLYRTYGDRDTLRTYYDNMVRYLEYLRSKASGNLLDYGLGDWATINTTTPAGVTASYGYYKSADALAKIAAVLGEAEDAATYRQLAADIGTAFNAKFFDAARHTYANGSQASDALALDMGIVPAGERQAVLDHLVANLQANTYHLNIGEIGLASLFRVLTEAGRDDVIYRIATQTSQPSYGAMLARGATSLTEFWDGSGSQNHFMLGAIDEWFSKGLAGIQQAQDSIGYERLVIKPALVDELAHVEASYDSPRGLVSIDLQRGTRMAVTVPAGANARVYVPAAESERFVGVGGVAVPVGREPGYQVFDVEPGEVTFVRGTSTPGDVGGTVPPTLSLTLGPAATFGAFTPGVAKTYEAQTTATVTSTAADATLHVSDPSPVAPGRLVNGTFSLPSPLLVRSDGSFAPVGGSASPTPLRSYGQPVANDAIPIAFQQTIGSNDALRTGRYGKTLTFTLSTTNP